MEDKKKDVKKEELAKEFVKTLGELENIDDVENMIRDNKIDFTLKDVKYRVRQLNFDENTILEKFRRTKYLEFVNDDSMKFSKQWIKLYKEKGISIDEMEQNIRDNIQRENKLMLLLAQTGDKDKDKVEELKNQIIEIRKESALINIEKVDLMSFSIEDQLMIAVNSYFTYLALEKMVDKDWKRVYESFEEFSKSPDTTLTTKAFQYSNALIYHNGF